ncbi:MAG: hypothetical protein ACKOEV_10555 [Cytophagales bacterium]
MKKMFSLVILHIAASFSYAQSATDFLTRYNLLERIISLTQKHIFKFDAESLNLLETENSNITSSGDKFVSYTKYLHYQTKEGILIPSIVSYSSTFCEAVLEYKQITFR